MTVTRASLCLLVACLLAGSVYRPGYAVEIHPKAGTTAASFLKIGIGSRADGMGTAFTGLADDVTALYWNPAGLARLERRSLSVTHNESFESIRHDFAGYAWGRGTTRWAAAIYGLYIPSELERRSGLDEDNPFEPLTPIEGYFGAHDICAQFSAGHQATPSLAVGASIKAIQQSIDDLSAYGVGVDASALYRVPNSRLSVGAGVFNAGTPITFREKSYMLPLTFRGGGALRVHDRLTCTAEATLAYDNFPSVAGGIEYTPVHMITVRGGYRYRLHGLPLGDLSGVSAGMGLSLPLRGMTLAVDYAFVPYGMLGNSQRISVTMMFGDTLSPSSGQRRVSAQSPASPATPRMSPDTPAHDTAGAPDPADGYTFTSYPLMRTLKRAAGRSVLYVVRAENTKEDLSGITAIVPAFVLQNASVDIGWKKGTGRVFRLYKVAAAPFRLERVALTIRLPASLNAPYAAVSDGTRYPLTVSSAAGGAVVYTVHVPVLQDFMICHEQ